MTDIPDLFLVFYWAVGPRLGTASTKFLVASRRIHDSPDSFQSSLGIGFRYPEVEKFELTVINHKDSVTVHEIPDEIIDD